MRPSDFLAKARATISTNPHDRLSPKTKAIVDNDNFVADIHCHYFDVKCINIKYFLLRFLKDKLGLRDDQAYVKQADPNVKYLNTSYDTIYNNETLDTYMDSDQDWDDLLAELEYVTEKEIQLENNADDTTRGVFDIVQNRKILKCKDMKEVYEYYLEKFGLNQKDSELGYEDKDIITTALMMDLATGWGVKLRKGLVAQIEELKQLSQEVPILPYYAVDPRRETNTLENLYELFLLAFPEQGPSFFGLKVYPGLGYLPSDYRLFPIYEICQEKNIPVLAHCGGEAVTTQHLNISVFRKDVPVAISGQNRQEVGAQLNHPKEWIPVLEAFPNLKLNLGHFGGDHAWEQMRDQGSSEKVATILDMMEKYPGLYADFSYNLIDPALYSIFKTVLDLKPAAAKKALFGSDFWVVCAEGNLRKKQKDFLERLDNHREAMIHGNIKNYLFV